MPFNDEPLGFGSRRRISLLGGGSGIGRTRAPETAAPPDLEQVWPDSPQMEAAREEYAAKNELPLWARILSVPSNILGREAITSGLEGFGKAAVEAGGWDNPIGAALAGAAGFVWEGIKGEADAISHFMGLRGGMDVTNFRDIRKAFGDTSTDDGIDNFAINLLGDLATDPALWLNPLGFLAKGTSQLGKIHGLTLAEQVTGAASVIKPEQFINALRGGIVFRVPIFGQTGYDVLEGLAKLPLPFFDKFKSLNVQFARAMDKTYELVRTAPGIGPILQKFGASPIPGVKEAASVRAYMIASTQTQEILALKGVLQKINNLDDNMKEYLANSDRGKAINDFMELGFEKVDNRGVIMDHGSRMHQVMRDNAFRGAWGKKLADGTYKGGDENLRKLWYAAARGDDDSVAAIKKLYDTYDFRIPRKWLDDAGLPPRPDIEVEAADTLAGALGQASLATGVISPSAGEVARATATAQARGAGEIGQQAFFAAQKEARLARFRKVWEDVDNGVVTEKDLNYVLSIHKEANEASLLADQASDAINGYLENYLPRVKNPAIKKFLDKQQNAGMGQFKFAGGNPFGKARKLTDMTKNEANDFLMQIGTKMTGFVGIDKSVETFKRELAEYGPWAVLNVLFPKAVVNKINRIDEEMGSFFLTDPVKSDIWRLNTAIDIRQRSEFFKLALHKDSPLVLDHANMGDPDAVMSLAAHAAQNPHWKLRLVSEKGTLSQPRGVGEIVTSVVGKDMEARIGIHAKHTEQEIESILDDVATPFEPRIQALRDVQKLNTKSSLTWTDKTPYTEMRLKRALKQKADTRNSLAAARDELGKLRLEARDAKKGLSSAAHAQIDALDKKIAHLSSLIDSNKSQLEMLTKGGIDWKNVDAINTEVSQGVEDIMAAQTALDAAKAAKRKVRVGKAGPVETDIGGATVRLPKKQEIVPTEVGGAVMDLPDIPTYERVIERHQQTVIDAAAAFTKAHAEEMSIRAALKHSLNNLDVAQGEILAGRAATAATQSAALKGALSTVRSSIKPEMMSNEVKLWYRFRKNGDIGWEELSLDAQARAMKTGGGGTLIAVNDEHWEGLNRYWENFNAPDSMRGTMFARVMDPLRRWFMASTVMHPAMVNTRMADVVGGNVVLMQAGLFSPKSFMEAEQMTRLAGEGLKKAMTPGSVLSQKMLVHPTTGATMDAATFLSKLQTRGLLDSDWINDVLMGNVMDAAVKNSKSTGRKMVDNALGFFGFQTPSLKGDWTGAIGLQNPATNPTIRLGGKMARYGDNTVRISAALQAWKKNPTGNLDEAIQEAVHWTYGAGKDLTSFERHVAKRFIPFYGFMKWSASRMAEMWLHKPGTVSWLTRVRDNAYAALDMDPADNAKVMPKFVNDNLGIPVSMTAEGPKMYLFGKLFPMGQVFDMVSAMTNIVTGHPDEGLRYIAGNMHPAIKTALELVVNRDFFSGRDLATFPGERKELLGVSMPAEVAHVLGSWFRGLKEADRLNIFNAEEMTVAIDAVRRSDILGRRKELPLIERWLSGAFGPLPIKGYQIDYEEELRRQRRIDAEKLSKDKALMRKAVQEGDHVEVQAMSDVVADELASIEARHRLASKALIDEQAASKRKVRLVR